MGVETVLLFVAGVLVVAIGLAVSVGLHEVGHLLPAKLFGVKVTQYMIGFGPTVFSRRRGETEYGLKAFPLGGYISMIGMFPPAKEGGKVRSASTGFFQQLVQDARTASEQTVAPGDEDRVFYRLPVWKRVVIMAGGPFMNLVIAVVLFAVVLMGFGISGNSTTVGSVSACLKPATAAAQECTAEDEQSPAAAAGLLPGDRLVSFDGVAVSSYAQVQTLIEDSPGDAVPVVVDRAGQQVDLTVTPVATEKALVGDDGRVVESADGEPVTRVVGMIGFSPASELQPQPATGVLPMVGQNISAVAGIILNLPQRLIDVANAAFGPGERDPNGPMSVVGVGRAAGEIASIDAIPLASKAATLLGMIASLNVALFVFNLVPLLPLDGGHIAGALWEGLRRSFARLLRRRDPGPVDTAKLMPLTFAVVILIGGMSVLLIYADIVKPVDLFG